MTAPITVPASQSPAPAALCYVNSSSAYIILNANKSSQFVSDKRNVTLAETLKMGSTTL